MFSASLCLRFRLLQKTRIPAIRMIPRSAMPIARPILAALDRPPELEEGLSTLEEELSTLAACALAEAVEVGIEAADVT